MTPPMKAAMHKAALIVLLLPLLTLLPPPAAGQGNSAETLRTAQPVKLTRDGKSQPLRSGKSITPGDRVLTGAEGRAEIRFATGDVLTLGSDSELHLYRLLPSLGGAPPQAQLILTRGALRAQAVAGDLRLNLGPLKLRIYGAEVWVAAEPRGETVCLLQGALEVIAETGNERLDVPGDCLLFSAQNRRLLIKPAPEDSLERKLARTAFSEPPPPEPVAPPPGDVTITVRLPEPVPAALPDEPDALSSAVTAQPAAVLGTWCVVLASHNEAAKADREVHKLRARGLEAVVREQAGRWRVVVTGFASRADAQSHARSAGSGAWVLKE